MGHHSLLDYFYVGVGWGLVRGGLRGLILFHVWDCTKHGALCQVSIKDATECMDSGTVHSIVRGLEK